MNTRSQHKYSHDNCLQKTTKQSNKETTKLNSQKFAPIKLRSGLLLNTTISKKM